MKWGNERGDYLQEEGDRERGREREKGEGDREREKERKRKRETIQIVLNAWASYKHAECLQSTAHT